MSVYFFSFCGAILAGLAVALGAFGAHALKDILGTYEMAIWEKAVFYESIHALALLILPVFNNLLTPRGLNITGNLFISGTILFSGSLYLLALSGRKYLGLITPLGGMALLLGWVWLAAALYQAAFKA